VNGYEITYVVCYFHCEAVVISLGHKSLPRRGTRSTVAAICTVGNDQLRWPCNQSRDGEVEKNVQENGFIREDDKHINRM